MIMNEDFVPFELAKKLKEKGFPQRTFGSYDMVGPTYFSDGRFYKDGCICHKDEAYTAPTIPQVMEWLRNEKKIFIVVCIDNDSDCPVIYNIFRETDCVHHHHGKYFALSEWSKCEMAGIKTVINKFI